MIRCMWTVIMSPMMMLCVSEPKFIAAFGVPESDNPDDDKVFFFFRETAVEAQGFGKVTYARIGQLCRVRNQSFMECLFLVPFVDPFDLTVYIFVSHRMIWEDSAV